MLGESWGTMSDREGVQCGVLGGLGLCQGPRGGAGLSPWHWEALGFASSFFALLPRGFPQNKRG